MRTLNYRIKTGRGQQITIIPFGDQHFGSKGCDEAGIRKLVKWIAPRPNTYWIGMGDYIDGVNISDSKRFDPETYDDNMPLNNLVNAQIRKAIEIFKPIAHKCIGLLEGNHEEHIKKYYHADVNYELCKALKVNNLTYTGWIQLTFHANRCTTSGRCMSRQVTIFAYHGKGGGVTWGGNINKIMQLALTRQADIYLMGHCHKKLVIPLDVTMLTSSRGDHDPDIVDKKRVFVLTGSFLKTYVQGCNTYSDVAGYAPVPLGVARIDIEPFRHTSKTNSVGKRTFPELPPHIHASV